MVVPEAFLVRDCCVRMAPVGGSGAASLSAAEAGFMMALSSLHPPDNNNNAGKREKREDMESQEPGGKRLAWV